MHADLAVYVDYVWVLVRGGVLEDVLGLEDTFWNPWPWSLSKSSKIALSSARGQHYFFELLKFCRSPEKHFDDLFFWRSPEKKFWRPFLWRTLALVSLASSIPVLDLERVCPRKGCSRPWTSAVAMGGQGAVPPVNIILLRSIFDSLRNCWQPTAVHKSNGVIHLIKYTFTDVSRKREVRQQNCYRYFVSDHDMKQYVETFFSKTSCFDF